MAPLFAIHTRQFYNFQASLMSRTNAALFTANHRHAIQPGRPDEICSKIIAQSVANDIFVKINASP
jgi:hypothetical protein